MLTNKEIRQYFLHEHKYILPESEKITKTGSGNDFCTECRQVRPYTLKSVKINKPVNGKDMEFHITSAVCDECGKEIHVHGIIGQNMKEISEQLLNKRNAATVAANFLSIGYEMTGKDVDVLSKASKEDIIEFYKTYSALIKEELGSHDYHPFYPNYPEEVMTMTDYEMLIDQIIYGFSGLVIKPDLFEKEKERFPFIGTPVRHQMSKGSEEDYLDSVKNVLASQKAWSPDDRNYISVFVREEKDTGRLNEILPYKEMAGKMPCHENRVALTIMRMDAGYLTGNETATLSGIVTTLPDITDILRFAAARSAEYDDRRGKDVSLLKDKDGTLYGCASLRFRAEKPSFILPRSDRKIVMAALEQNISAYGEKAAVIAMTEKRKMWKQVIKNLHLKDFRPSEKLTDAFAVICSNAVVDRPSRRIEEALKKGDVITAAMESAKRPGDYVRRFDALLRRTDTYEQQEAVLAGLRAVGKSASVSTLMALDGMIAARSEADEERVFVSPKNMKRTVTNEKNRQAIPKDLIGRVHDTVCGALSDKFAGKEPMGKVYISDSMKDYTVPGDSRQASSGKHYGTGSVIHVTPSSPFQRFFVWWKDCEEEQPSEYEDYDYSEARVDIDLSVSMYDADMNLKQIVAWNEMFADREEAGYVFSGDCQSGQGENGGAEFIDVKLDTLKKHGIRYLIPSVHVYTGQQFSSIPTVDYGYMDRVSIGGKTIDNGQLYEMASVVTKMSLTSQSVSNIPMIFDLGEDADNNEYSIIWADLPEFVRTASSSAKSGKDIVKYVRQKSGFSLHDLIRLNAEVNGEIVLDPSEADIIFAAETEMPQLCKEDPELRAKIDDGKVKVVYPWDSGYITGILLPEGPDA